jgi:hypothetical protein
VQSLIVGPNELVKETPYIDRNIKFTRAAFGLNEVEEKPFAVSYALTSEDVRDNPVTISNIRLWDHRPLRSTYRQLQGIRTYYQFSGVDTDRYLVDGKLTQVMLAAREIDFTALPQGAQTWVNEHLQWTHGYGLAMSPANAVTPEGRPDFLIKNIPPETRGIPVERPEVYYGEFGQTSEEQAQPSPIPGGEQPPGALGGRLPLRQLQPSPSPQAQTSDDYVIVQTSTKEFDYPTGDKNVYENHQGTGGVAIGSLLRRLAFALRFAKLDIAITSSIAKESRIIFNREVTQRARLIAPFLRYDRDPYLVVSGGSLFWILDAYTATDKYPYSQRYADGVNYVRNSVKVVINAYNGATDFYVFDEKDPLILTYQKMFPTLFKAKEQMPPDLMKHVRYPKGLFSLQAEVLATYHMQDPQVLYNREDRWNLAQELMSSSETGSVGVPMEPYYMVMRLPGEERGEFILMIPFTPYSSPDSPAPKDNMIAWLGARCGPDKYGQLMLFEFPKDEVIYGPKQIGGFIDQDPGISASFTLWGQGGSSVIRGHLLVIPIDHSLIYVQPIYLQATGGAIPELERVIVAFGERLAMKNSLQEALQSVFGTAKAPATVPPAPSSVAGPPPAGPPSPAATTKAAPAAGGEQLLLQAEEQLRRTEEANRKTEQELQALREVLGALRKQSPPQ